MLKDMWKFWKEYFVVNPKRWKPIFLFSFIIIMEFCLVYLNVCFNEWRNDFYNSLQNVDYPAFTYNIKKFLLLALIFVGLIGYKIYMTGKLQIIWRKWMTEKYLDRWLDSKMYYGLQFLPQSADNADQRISEDINNFVLLSMSLSLGLLSSLTTFFSFISILWFLSDGIDIALFDHHFFIGHYLVWAVLLYSIIGTYITRKIGKPLSGLNYMQELLEANFRYSLIRVRENSESVALYDGEKFENNKFKDRFGKIFSNFNLVNNKQKHLNWWSSYFGQVAVVFPYIVNAPRFFAGTIKLGGLMQAASAFDSVQVALGWMVDSYINLANFKAVINRLKGFNKATDEWAELQSKKKLAIQESNITTDAIINNLSVYLPDNSTLIKDQTFTLSIGKKYIISGSSGLGKSTLLKTFANIWPYAEGLIYYPRDFKKMFISQNSYIPLGTLSEVIAYPGTEPADVNLVVDLLILLELNDLVFKLNEEKDWNKILSGGQKQKIAFIRAILQHPDILFIDEGTSALDEKSEKKVYEMLLTYLTGVTVISVGHSQTIDKYHDFKLQLENKTLNISK